MLPWGPSIRDEGPCRNAAGRGLTWTSSSCVSGVGQQVWLCLPSLNRCTGNWSHSTGEGNKGSPSPDSFFMLLDSTLGLLIGENNRCETRLLQTPGVLHLPHGKYIMGPKASVSWEAVGTSRRWGERLECSSVTPASHLHSRGQEFNFFVIRIYINEKGEAISGEWYTAHYIPECLPCIRVLNIYNSYPARF